MLVGRSSLTSAMPLVQTAHRDVTYANSSRSRIFGGAV
jgi:hypothetical protein